MWTILAGVIRERTPSTVAAFWMHKILQVCKATALQDAPPLWKTRLLAPVCYVFLQDSSVIL